MNILDAITVLKVRKKSYVLFYAGLKRGHITYDVMAPDGTQICTGVPYDDALEACQLHYVEVTPPPGRVRKIRIKKVRLGSLKRLNQNNDVQSDRTHLGDYAEWSFENDDNFNLSEYSRRFL